MSTAVTGVPLPAHIQHWADEQVKFEASGLTIREFCRQNQLGISGFYKRRALVRELGYPGLKGRRTDQSKSLSTSTPVGFVDAGVLEPNRRNNSLDADTEMALAAAAPTSSGGLRKEDTAADASVEVRIDLGMGVVLTIARR
jgi:hypothetical protein